MAARCYVCGRGTAVSYKVSHSNIHTKVKRRPNLQRVRVIWEGAPQRIRVCTSCLKAGKVKKAA